MLVGFKSGIEFEDEKRLDVGVFVSLCHLVISLVIHGRDLKLPILIQRILLRADGDALNRLYLEGLAVTDDNFLFSLFSLSLSRGHFAEDQVRGGAQNDRTDENPFENISIHE